MFRCACRRSGSLLLFVINKGILNYKFLNSCFICLTGLSVGKIRKNIDNFTPCSHELFCLYDISLFLKSIIINRQVIQDTFMHKEVKFSKSELIEMLLCKGREETELYASAARLRDEGIGNGVHLRGLIEISNICRKNCLYCGIRRDNCQVEHYNLGDSEILSCAQFAYEHRYGSIVLQGGERTDKEFVLRIEKLLKEIKKLSNNELGITLSLGEQEYDTYKRWFESGAHRYLLRIETSNPVLYRKIHPNDHLHSYTTRIGCLENLQKCGYQTGSGVMIGLPFQTTDDLAEDLLFLKSLDLDMVGMGPYLEHQDTPLYQYRGSLLPLTQRLSLSIHMVACLRLLMPDINIAATTALQAIHPLGREQALRAGANVIMPNITPAQKRGNYKLYNNKPNSEESTEEMIGKLIASVREAGCEIALGEWGDSQHYANRHKISSSE